MSDEKKQNNGGKKTLLLIFIFILLALNGVQVWFNMSNQKEAEVQITAKNTEIEELVVKVDSMVIQLEDRKAEIAKLGGDTASLGQKIRELMAENNDLRRNMNAGWAKYNALKSKLEGYETLLKQKDEELAKLQQEREQLFTENTGLKTDKVALKDSIVKITNVKDDLQKKVDIASVMRAENIKPSMFNSKGKEYDASDMPWKSKKIAKIQVAFNLGKNEVAEKETKPIYMRILEPEGSALYDLSTGGGTFTINGKDQYYTAKKDVLFGNKNELVSFAYQKGSPFKVGKHTIEIYEGENLIGKSDFTVK